MREIRLYGELGKRFGRVHRMAVETAAEAIRALQANFPGFERAILEVAPAYRVMVGDVRINSDGKNLLDPSSDRDTIRISPVLSGAKQGLGQVILGVVMIAIGAVLTYTGIGSGFAGFFYKFGAVMILGGVIQMLSPQPKLPSDSGERQGNKPSYAFNGPINTTAQGHPVPVGYGRLIVGSAVISAGMFTEDIPIAVEPTAGDWLQVFDAIGLVPA